MRQNVTIQARKYNQHLHYDWQAYLVEHTEEYALVYCEAGRTFIHHTKQKQFTMPYPSLEWFFFDRGYTVAISFKPDGLMYYCNIALPASFESSIVSFVDLDLDYLREVGEQWKVVDEDEFERHRELMHYDDNTVAFAHNSLQRIKIDALHGHYPFTLDEVELKLLLNKYKR